MSVLIKYCNSKVKIEGIYILYSTFLKLYTNNDEFYVGETTYYPSDIIFIFLINWSSIVFEMKKIYLLQVVLIVKEILLLNSRWDILVIY